MAAVLAGSITYVLFRRLRYASAHTRVNQVAAAATDFPSGTSLTVKDVIFLDRTGSVPLS